MVRTEVRMQKQSITRTIAGTAIVGSIILGSLMSTIWNGDEAPEWARLIATLVEPTLTTRAAASTMSQPDERYFTYGQATLALYGLLWVAGVGSRHGMPKWTQWAVAAGGLLATSGDLLAYWVSASMGPAVRHIGFWWLELPALGFVAIALTIAGVLGWQRRDEARVWVLASPVAMIGTVTLEYLPHGILLGLATTLWIAAAATARRSQRP